MYGVAASSKVGYMFACVFRPIKNDLSSSMILTGDILGLFIALTRCNQFRVDFINMDAETMQIVINTKGINMIKNYVAMPQVPFDINSIGQKVKTFLTDGKYIVDKDRYPTVRPYDRNFLKDMIK